MKKREQHFYTAKELTEIIDRATAAGITSIKIPGFEAQWEIPQAPRRAGVATEAEPPKPAGPRVVEGVEKLPPKKCIACSETLKHKGNVGNLCVRCYRARHGAPEAREEDHGDCLRCGDKMRMGSTSGQLYCHRCWTESRDRENR